MSIRHSSPPVDLMDQLAFSAWPSEEVIGLDGWQLRLNHGTTRRANSVWTNDSNDADDIETKISKVERLYGERSLPPCFYLSPAARPPTLDTVLANRGYAKVTPTLVQTAALDTVGSNSAPLASEVSIYDDISPDWSRVHSSLAGHTSEQAANFEEIERRIALPKAFALLRAEGVPAAVGLAVVERDWMGLFDMVTAEGFRKRGAARAVLVALSAWANRQGSTHAWLGVVEANQPARRLYEGMGFTTLYMYHYRELQVPPARSGKDTSPGATYNPTRRSRTQR